MNAEMKKMLGGEIYDPNDAELANLRIKAHKLSHDYNATYEDEDEKRLWILDRLIPNRGKNCFIQGPIQFDYGIFITVGDNFKANSHFTVIDTCPISIGNNVYFGPNCTLATVMRSFDPEERRMKENPDGSVYEPVYGKPITIGNDCWIASNVVICAGVNIGDGCVIGAGSVVTRDIPAGSFAAGNPCRVIRKAAEK